MAEYMLQGKRVVIVEDEALTKMHLVRTMNFSGLQIVGVAPNGQIGVEKVLAERPDIVIMDINMPVLNGLDAAQQIMDVAPVCIVILTAYSTEEHQQRADDIGISAYIVKPVTSAMLLPELEQAYQKFQRRQVAA